MTTSVDKGLIKKARRGDGLAFSMLIEKHEKFVFNVVYRMVNNIEDAKDISQEAFIKAFKSFDTYDGSAAFSTWIYRIAVNAAIDHMRKQKREQSVSFDEYITDDTVSTMSVEESVVSNEGKGAILDAVNKLEEEFKTVVVLRDIHGMDYSEISDITGCPVGTVKSRLSRARGKLRNMLKNDKIMQRGGAQV